MPINTQEVMRKFNIRPVKSLGQNFLSDDGIIKHIVDAAEVSKDDLVIEIGPGMGNMTMELASRAGNVVAIEIDKYLIPVLKSTLKDYKNVHIINKDVMKIDFNDILSMPELRQNVSENAPVKVIANLPYYITTPVIMKLLEDGLNADLMVFMIQKEVAERINAKPGIKDYGALTVAVQYYSKPSTVFEVPSEYFFPQPKVDSAVIKLEIYKTPPVNLLSKDLFFRIVKASFAQRRKTLVNGLNNSGLLNFDKDKIKEMLASMGIHENQRGETLTILQFSELANYIFNSR